MTIKSSSRRKKPLGWPKYMIEKRLKAGVVAYYWSYPKWAQEKGCPIERESLGTDYGTAKQKCDEVLNPQFEAWLRKDEKPESEAARFGSFDWLVSIYKQSPRYTNRPEKTRRSYDDALAMAAKHALKDGRKFGQLDVRSISPGAADKLYEAIKVGKDGKVRGRSAVLSMVVAKLAWNAARRSQPKVIPAENPFAGMQLSHKAKRTRPATHDELMRFVAEADQRGAPAIGTAAMIAYYWLQRQTDIISRLSWSHYKPVSNPGIVQIRHHKTGEEIDLPLYDETGAPLWPEIMDRLDASSHFGTLIVTKAHADRKRGVHLPYTTFHFRHQFIAIRRAAGIDDEVKFMGLRHGGNTEGANAGLSDAQLRALSGHKSSALLIYAQETVKQRLEGAKKRRDARTKRADLSE